MYEDQTLLQIVGQIMIATLFLGTGAINVTTKVKQHLERMNDMNVPLAGPLLFIGFVMQFVGGAMLLRRLSDANCCIDSCCFHNCGKRHIPSLLADR